MLKVRETANIRIEYMPDAELDMPMIFYKNGPNTKLTKEDKALIKKVENETAQAIANIEKLMADDVPDNKL